MSKILAESSEGEDDPSSDEVELSTHEPEEIVGEAVNENKNDEQPTTSAGINMNTSLEGGVKKIILKKFETTTNSIAMENHKANVKRVPTHVMVDTAIIELNERAGSSLVAIRNYIMANYPNTEEKRVNSQIKRYLKESLIQGKLAQLKRSFKLTPEAKKAFLKEKTKQLKIKKKVEKNFENKAKKKEKTKEKAEEKKIKKIAAPVEKKKTIKVKTVTSENVKSAGTEGKTLVKKPTESKKAKPKLIKKTDKPKPKPKAQPKESDGIPSTSKPQKKAGKPKARKSAPTLKATALTKKPKTKVNVNKTKQ